MIRLILRALNAPVLLALVAIAVAVQSSLFNSHPLHFFQPDLPLIAVIWCGLRRNFTEGGILTLLMAEIVEIHSSSPSGLMLLSYMLIYLGIRLAAKVLVIPNISSLTLVTLGASIAWKLILLTMLFMLDSIDNQWRHTLIFLLPGAAVTGVISLWAYRWLDRFDWATFKSQRAQQMLEDELRLEGEGL